MPVPNDNATPSPTTLHLCLLHNDLQPLREEFLEVFAKLHGAGLLGQAKRLRFMKLWRTVSPAAGPALSWDLYASLVPFLALSEEDRGLLPALAISQSAEGDCHAQLRASITATSSKLRQSTSFKQLDDGCTGLLVQTLDDAGHLGYATNAIFDQYFPNMAERQHGVEQLEGMAFPLFFFASFLAPSDRTQWFAGIMEGFFRTDGRHSYCTIIKVKEDGAGMRAGME
jgi:hypothetical protein